MDSKFKYSFWFSPLEFCKIDLLFEFPRLGFLLHPTELQTLWSALNIAKDGLVHYAELFDYFINRTRQRGAAQPARTNAPQQQRKERAVLRETQSQHPSSKRQSGEDASRDMFGTPAEDIISRIRPQVSITN